ncbi:hypothetical protein PPS11_38095 [Pseudomonas putida S11]|nr:hypothetical protein PPS11_38095 [Pseudomonas putida S11]
MNNPAKSPVQTLLLFGRTQQAQHPRSQPGIPRHHQHIHGDHGHGDRHILGQQRFMRIDELRQHRQHEHQRLGVADVDQETTEHQAKRFADRTHGGFIAHVQGQRTPLFVGQVDEVGDTEPLDDLERCGRGSQNSADAGGDDGDLQDQAQLQAQGVPVTTPKTVLQATGHRGNRPGAG